jgi:hypothetical protein
VGGARRRGRGGRCGAVWGAGGMARASGQPTVWPRRGAARRGGAARGRARRWRPPSGQQARRVPAAPRAAPAPRRGRRRPYAPPPRGRQLPGAIGGRRGGVERAARCPWRHVRSLTGGRPGGEQCAGAAGARVTGRHGGLRGAAPPWRAPPLHTRPVALCLRGWGRSPPGTTRGGVRAMGPGPRRGISAGREARAPPAARRAARRRGSVGGTPGACWARGAGGRVGHEARGSPACTVDGQAAWQAAWPGVAACRAVSAAERLQRPAALWARAATPARRPHPAPAGRDRGARRGDVRRPGGEAPIGRAERQVVFVGS